MNNEKSKEIIKDNIEQLEKLTERYIEAEQFIMNLSWFERLFFYKKRLKFLKSRNKYKF